MKLKTRKQSYDRERSQKATNAHKQRLKFDTSYLD